VSCTIEIELENDCQFKKEARNLQARQWKSVRLNLRTVIRNTTAASASEGRSRGLNLTYLPGVAGGVGGAGFFSRCGTRSM
jgi:hypothetical protein